MIDAGGRLLEFLVLPRKGWWEYAVLFALGCIPIVIALVIGAFQDAIYPANLPPADGKRFAGYWSSFNWTTYVILLPVSLRLLRYLCESIVDARPRERDPLPLPTMFEDRDAAEAVRREIASIGRSPGVFWCALCVTMVIHVFDMYEPLMALSPFVDPGHVARAPAEPDWSVIHLAGTGVSRLQNLLLIATAYSCQFIMVFLGIALLMLIYSHNTLFLRLIYLRNRSRPVDRSILLRLDDRAERRFGLSKLYPAFNSQLRFLFFAGLLMVFSRAVNAYRHKGKNILDLRTFQKYLRDGDTSGLPAFWSLFPDMGQIALLIGWISLYVGVALPSGIKFLAWFSNPKARRNRRDFILEFTPPSERDSDPAYVDQLEKDFLCNSFWPIGDPQAKRWYLLGYFVALFVVLPLPLNSSQDVLVSILFVISILGTAWLLTLATFRLYRWVLDFSATNTTR